VSNVLIQQAMEAALNDFAASGGYPVAWENTKFQPDPDVVYLVPYFMPNVTDSIDLQQKTRIYQGIFQVMVVWPAGMGTIGAKAVAEAIAEAFPNGWETLAGSVRVYTDRPAQVSAGLSDDVSYNVPVSIYYRTDI